MTEQELLSVFPNAVVRSSIPLTSGTIVLPLQSKEWLVIHNHLTSEQRDYLETYYQTNRQKKWAHQKWYQYLVLASSECVLQTNAVQFIHIHVHDNKQLSKEAIHVFYGMFPTIIDSFWTSSQDIIFILDVTNYLVNQKEVQDILSVIEFDFNAKISVLIGQIWSIDSLPKLFQTEQVLFKEWLANYTQPSCLLFSQLLLWQQRHSKEDVSFLYSKLRQLIQKHEQIDSIIIALWEESAVLTKAAQKIYMHRNTLQYKMDKFHEQTGLSLKCMDDLVLCYFLLKDY